MKFRSAFGVAGCLAILLLSACVAVSAPEASPAVTAPATAQSDSDDDFSTIVHPDVWPQVHEGVPDDPAIDARAADILSKMSVEEKVGQIIQGYRGSAPPADVRAYHLGSILDGGSSGPYGND